MAIQSTNIYAIQPVRAGDLITAAFVNGLITALQDLDDRVADLEASAPPGSPPRGTGKPTRPKAEIGGLEAAISHPAERLQDEISGVQSGRAVGMKPRDD